MVTIIISRRQEGSYISPMPIYPPIIIVEFRRRYNISSFSSFFYSPARFQLSIYIFLNQYLSWNIPVPIFYNTVPHIWYFNGPQESKREKHIPQESKKRKSKYLSRLEAALTIVGQPNGLKVKNTILLTFITYRYHRYASNETDS